MKIVESKLITLMEEGKTNKQIAEHFECSVRAVQSYKTRLARRGFSPENDMDHIQNPLFMVKGQSTYYNKEGNPTQRWVKTKLDNEQWEQLIADFISGISSSIPRHDPVPAPVLSLPTDRLNLYPFTDFHLGMLAWGEESGDDWDMTIAEDLAVKWIDAAVAMAPQASTAVLANMGDFLHWDGMEAVTPTSRHVLDADSRFQKLVRVALRIIRTLIDRLLATHDKVHVIMAEGNHDESSSVWLREGLSLVYEKEPRVTWDKSADPYYHYSFGKTMLMFHHGHKANMRRVESAMLGKFIREIGQADYRYCHVGHLHHAKLEETTTMLIEQHRTLAAKDAYASRGGWVSKRSASVITYHADFGEIARQTISPEMLGH
ncbi:DNA repair exonuclease [Erwinia phage vB_EamP-S2]|uniref:Hypotheticla protein n=1 Tax=Erwinia phage vB_EamP-S2 TaxID=2070198 RepID=A0A2K9V526_9CAUD|nr:DNA repair exonuclease [Erwinia phage vB_EamP-S2]AUV57222.1 hypotheticla protein [Erwinia phage vB_EamP-S2]UNA00914.1 hypothetical protein VLVyarbaL_00027 [Erwinia phage VyarbaL]